MRVPLSWLREYVTIDLPERELFEVMGRSGLEIDDVHRPGAGAAGVVAARVLDVRDHPDADRLIVATVDAGQGERTVCAGARNIAAGDLVPYAPPGAQLPDGQGGTFTLEARTMRGIVSEGMLCSPKELQVADDHSGIMVLDRPGVGGGLAAEPGAPVGELLALGEPVLDIAVPADRGDLHSVLGVARDLAAILDVAMRPPWEVTAPSPDSAGPVPVRIDAPDGCARYVGWAVDDVTVGSAPWWLRRRLEACGIRSISDLVDVTNYVMLELGQPLHAFDLDALHGPEIVVRWAQAGEALTTLDGRDRRLEDGDLVIADADRAVALAGVMGGADTEVGGATRRVLLEAAWFDPASVRRTSRRLGLVSEASRRFERRVDPAVTATAAARAVALLAELTGGRDGGVSVAGDVGPVLPAPVTLDPSWTAGFLGLPDLDAGAQTRLLNRAGLWVDRRDGLLEATPPSWRGDLTGRADLAEEIARLHGYERIPATLPRVALRGGLSPRQRGERDVRAAVRAFGFHEAQTTSFAPRDALVLVADHPDRVALANPLSRESDVMRPSLVEGLLGVVRHNTGQGRPGLAVFELGRVFRPVGGPLDDVAGHAGAWRWHGPDDLPLPTQPLVLGLAAYGAKDGPGWLDRDRPWELADVLAALDEVVARLAPPGLDGLQRLPGEHPALHPGRTALLLSGDGVAGVAGELHPAEVDRRDLVAPVVVAELVLEPLWAHLVDPSRALAYRQAPRVVRHPALTVDVAVVVDDGVPHSEVAAAVRAGAGDLLDRLAWFDEYRGEQVGAGRRSLAFRLRLQSPARQLTDADAERVIDGVAAAVESLGGTLRR